MCVGSVSVYPATERTTFPAPARICGAASRKAGSKSASIRCNAVGCAWTCDRTDIIDALGQRYCRNRYLLLAESAAPHGIVPISGAHKGHAFFAYATNYLIDTDHGVILDVEATRAIRQAEVGASRTMIDRTESRFGLKPDYLAADSAYGSAENLAWLVKEKKVAPHIPVFDKSNRTDGTFSRSDFTWQAENDRYICPAGKELRQFHRIYETPRSGITSDGRRLYRASKKDCDACELKQVCCPNAVARKVPRDLNEDARDVARAIAVTPEYEQSRHRRKRVEMLFAHLKRILRMARLRLRGPCGARDEFLLAATAQNLRRLAELRPPRSQHCVIAA